MLESFLNKVVGFRPATLLKRNSGTVVFVWILVNILGHLFHRTPPEDWFWKF